MHYAPSDIKSQLADFSTSLLCKTFFKYQLDRHHAAKADISKIAPLSSMAIGSMLDALNTSDSPARDAKTIVNSISSTSLKRLIKHPKLSFQAARVLSNIAVSTTDPHWFRDINVDEIVLRNERFVRSRAEQNKDRKYLVKLNELLTLVPKAKMVGHGPTTAKTRCQIPRQHTCKPRGGLDVLDFHRNQNQHLTINGTNAAFQDTLKRITKGTLDELDWSNTFMAGGMALTTLLHTDTDGDSKPEVVDPDIDLYIYDLSPEDANNKVEHIYDVWKNNLPLNAQNHLVVKNAKTITLLPTYPHRRIQIVLKLLSSPTDILLNFDLDACAVGWDGSSVLMLPRFVRALETGYSVFSMDLIWGHHLRDRRATQDCRVFKYADRGFGIRFLPSYARSLEKGRATAALDEMEVNRAKSKETFYTRQKYQRDRYPRGSEPGLKTLKRIAYLGKDFVYRFYFGECLLPLTFLPRYVASCLK